jgi:hypothetical protein
MYLLEPKTPMFLSKDAVTAPALLLCLWLSSFSSLASSQLLRMKIHGEVKGEH